MTLTHLQKLPKNVRDLGKLIVAKGFKKLPKVQKIAQSGHTASSNQYGDLNKRPFYHESPSITPRPTILTQPFKLALSVVLKSNGY